MIFQTHIIKDLNVLSVFFDHLSDIFHTPDKNYIVLCPLLKKQIIINFKNKWRLIYQKPLPVKWLPDQEDVVSWAWDFIKKIL